MFLLPLTFSVAQLRHRDLTRADNLLQLVPCLSSGPKNRIEHSIGRILGYRARLEKAQLQCVTHNSSSPKFFFPVVGQSRQSTNPLPHSLLGIADSDFSRQQLLLEEEVDCLRHLFHRKRQQSNNRGHQLPVSSLRYHGRDNGIGESRLRCQYANATPVVQFARCLVPGPLGWRRGEDANVADTLRLVTVPHGALATRWCRKCLVGWTESPWRM